jgi:hypothetical protein
MTADRRQAKISPAANKYRPHLVGILCGQNVEV